MINALIEAYPDGVKVNGSCSPRSSVKGASTEVVNALLTAYPDGAKEKNYDDNIPLHIAVVNCASVEVVNALLTAYSDGVKNIQW